ncbi:MAG: hypothetical protein GX575_10545 [Candidatus Anammoximicrobium sp.]|nr:hypothetical protein [Candidatus Anammoximicrobium sp.]
MNPTVPFVAARALLKHGAWGLWLMIAGGAVCLDAEELRLIEQEQRIPPGQTAAFDFGTVPQRDTTVLLRVTARLHLAAPAGSMYFLRMELNGREIQPARSRRVIRLVNRPVESPVAANLPAPWFGNHAWRLLYSPNFDYRPSYCPDDPYTFVLDVTDLVNPAAENRLAITNTADKLRKSWTAPDGELVLRELSVTVRSGASPTMTAKAALTPVINTGQPAAGPARYEGRLAPGGGLAVTVGSCQWEFSSAFSYPHAGFNRLLAGSDADRTGPSSWTQRIVSPTRLEAAGPHYRLTRTVRFGPVKIEVADELTNLDPQAPLGLVVRHEVSLAALADPAVRLAGNPDPAVSDYYSPANPSVHVRLADQGLGMLAEDDVFRNQARLFCGAEPPVAGLRTEMLRLGPGESQTLRWSIWPVAGPDYFDFVNLVRADWGANFTVPGAWTFFHPDSILNQTPEQIREKFQRLGIRFACYCGGWVDHKHDRKRIGFGTGVLDDYWADFRSRLRQAAVRIREACPEVKVLVYYDTQRDTSETGHERFRDSWLVGPTGQPLSTEWGGVYSLTWSMVATLENSFGGVMLQAVERYRGEIGADGLYWDEMEGVAYGTPLVTYNMADGHSCLIDPKTYAIQREIGITTLLGEGHRLAVIERARRNGGAVMGNGPACTRAMLATGVPRMVEIQHNDSWCYEGNLGTPLGYMSSRMDFGNVVRALQMACLPVGTRYDYPHEISRYLFPFTPLELHAGYLLGRERIITLHSGSYGWPDGPCRVAVRHFDRDGKLTKTEVSADRTAQTAVQVGSGEAVVIERLPAEP